MECSHRHNEHCVSGLRTVGLTITSGQGHTSWVVFVEPPAIEVAGPTLGTEWPIRSDHELQNALVCATVSIESFDVEPVDHRGLFRW